LPAKTDALHVPGGASGPVEPMARVNSTALHLLAEDIRRERQFGAVSTRISDRWRNAVPATPYAPVLSKTRSGLGNLRAVPYGAGAELFQRRSPWKTAARANVQARRCWRPPDCSAISTS